jgi:hypothetical protein
MIPFLTFDGAQRQDPAVAQWFEGSPSALRSIARRWFTEMRDCGADTVELLHDGHPTACVDDAAFGYVNAFTSHVNVGFFHGAALPDPAGLLEGTGRFMRHVKIRPSSTVDEAALQQLIRAAYADIRKKLAGRRAP